MSRVALADSEAGREQALIRLMAEHKTSLMRLAYLCLGDVALAEDAVQDTFLKAYTHLDRFRGEASEKTWLTRILINTCRDVRRSAWFRLRMRTSPMEAAEERGKPDTYADDTVVQAVLALPERDRQVILLRFYQEMTVPELAEVLGVPVANAKSRLNRAKKRLRETLKGWYFDEE